MDDPPSEMLIPMSESQLATSISKWEGRVVDLLNSLGTVSEPTELEARRKAADLLRGALTALRQELIRAPGALTGVEELLRIRTAEAQYRGAVLGAWPPATLAREMTYLGASLFGAGGAAYALLGYPSFESKLIPAVLLWILGLGIVVDGLRRLRDHEARRWRYFVSTLRIPP